ncbi:MAG TPA: hypothetical protein PKD64_03270 [Pirellulaceae bacterium]|nr:hypothetical protein [Pirellulaceae bacterium]HMO91191.1 hypothetical protein [Pirellulaceae bacterium]HMP69039.1 hypothetical protein [Pirellulaceae bacterium]
MNDRNPLRISDTVLQKLVAGRLSDQEYREVLQILDQSEDGWKRCSLAFLEDQALKKELKQINFEALGLGGFNESVGLSEELPEGREFFGKELPACRASDESAPEKSLIDMCLTQDNSVGNDGDVGIAANYELSQFAGRKSLNDRFGTSRHRFGWLRHSRSPFVVVGLVCTIVFASVMFRLSRIDSHTNSNSIIFGGNTNKVVDQTVTKTVPVTLGAVESPQNSNLAMFQSVDELFEQKPYRTRKISSEVEVLERNGILYEVPIKRIEVYPSDLKRFR